MAKLGSEVLQHGPSGIHQTPYGDFSGKATQPSEPPLIDGANTKTITTNYASCRLYFNGTNYFTL